MNWQLTVTLLILLAAMVYIVITTARTWFGSQPVSHCGTCTNCPTPEPESVKPGRIALPRV